MQQAREGELRVRTSQLDAVVAAMQDAFGKIEVRRDDDRDLTLQMRSSGAAGLRVTRWSMSGRCSGDLELDDEHQAVLAGLALAGDVQLRSGATVVDTSRPYLCPDRFETRLDAPDVVNVALDRALLDAGAGALAGTDAFPVRFTSTAPLDGARSRTWRDTVAYASRVLATFAPHPEHALIRSAAVDLVCSVLLQTFPNTALEASSRGSTRPGAAVQRAIGFIDEHLAGRADPASRPRGSGAHEPARASRGVQEGAGYDADGLCASCSARRGSGTAAGDRSSSAAPPCDRGAVGILQRSGFRLVVRRDLPRDADGDRRAWGTSRWRTSVAAVAVLSRASPICGSSPSRSASPFVSAGAVGAMSAPGRPLGAPSAADGVRRPCVVAVGIGRRIGA